MSRKARNRRANRYHPFCGFCGVRLDSANRSTEHVLRQSWIRALGHEATPVVTSFHSVAGLVDVRNWNPMQMLAGEVCARCNTDWMEKLDDSVHPILTALARDPNAGVDIDATMGRLIGRWALRTAIAFELTAAPERRHIKASLARSLYESRGSDWLPDGFAAYISRAHRPTRGIGAAMLDVWPARSIEKVLQVTREDRFKFGAQYDNVIVGCCYFDGSSPPLFSGYSVMHQSVAQQGSGFAGRIDMPELHLEGFFADRASLTPLNVCVALIGVL